MLSRPKAATFFEGDPAENGDMPNRDVADWHAALPMARAAKRQVPGG